MKDSIDFMYYCVISGSTVADLHYGMDEQHPDCVALKLCLLDKITELRNRGITDFFCNCEYGLPMWATETIAAMRDFQPDAPRIHLIIPHEGQANLWHDEVRERYFNLHEDADSVTMLNTQYHEDCYAEADEFMIKRSVLLLTDGGNPTAAAYAKSKNKPVETLKLPIKR